jgi:hypothetical protein
MAAPDSQQVAVFDGHENAGTIFIRRGEGRGEAAKDRLWHIRRNFFAPG